MMADAKTWLERVRAGEPFQMMDWGFMEAIFACTERVARFNGEPDFEKRHAMFAEMFGKVGQDVVILPRLTLDVGINIEIGDNTFINANATLLDTYPIIIGSRVAIGPNVGFYPVGHPVQASGRNFKDAATGAPASLTTGAPIVIEDDVWIGGHVVIVPGVTIGARSVIAAGSVVTKSVPPDVVAGGNPCRVIKPIDNSGYSPFS
jgi:acetyltransferase-like isoleucine patch superfamily enzyme